MNYPRRNKEGWFDFQEYQPIHKEVIDFTYTFQRKSYASIGVYDGRKGFLRSTLNYTPKVFEPKLWREHKCQENCSCQVSLAYESMNEDQLAFMSDLLKKKVSLQVIHGSSEMRNIQVYMERHSILFDTYSKSITYLQRVIGHMKSLTTPKEVLEDVMLFKYPKFNEYNPNQFNDEYEKVNAILEMVSKEKNTQ